MALDDNDDLKLSALEDTPALRRLIEAVRKLSPEQKTRLLERMDLKSVIIPRYSMKPPEGEEPK